MYDADARPIRKRRIDRPVEFGYKAQVVDNDDDVVLDYSVEYGAAPDGPQLAPAIQRIGRRAGRVPRAVTADRGYGLPAVDRDLRALGVRTIVIPRQAKTSSARKATERERGFRKLVKSNSPVSCLLARNNVIDMARRKRHDRGRGATRPKPLPPGMQRLPPPKTRLKSLLQLLVEIPAAAEQAMITAPLPEDEKGKRLLMFEPASSFARATL